MTAVRVRRRGVIAGSGGGASFAVGSFAKATSTGTQAVTGVGFEPKALVLWVSGSAAASGTWHSSILQSIGFTSGASESYSVAGGSLDGQATSDTARRIAAKAVTLIEGNQTVRGEADLSSFDADGFTLDWTTANAAAYEIQFLAIGGDDVSAKVVNWTSPTATGNKAVTGVGFTPSVVLHGVVGTFSSMPESQTDLRLGFGAMDDGGGQWMNSVFAKDNQATSNTKRYQRTDKCIAYVSNTSTVEEEAEYVSMDADGFTTNFTTAVAAGVNYISLCLSGVSAKVGAVNGSGSTGDQAVTGVGFQPSSLLLSNTFAASTDTTVQGGATWSLGAYDGTNQRVVAQQDADAAATTDANSIWKNDAAVLVAASTAASIVGEADVGSLDADGFTLNWTDAHTTAVLYLALA